MGPDYIVIRKGDINSSKYSKFDIKLIGDFFKQYETLCKIERIQVNEVGFFVTITKSTSNYVGLINTQPTHNTYQQQTIQHHVPSAPPLQTNTYKYLSKQDVKKPPKKRRRANDSSDEENEPVVIPQASSGVLSFLGKWTGFGKGTDAERY